MMNHVVHIIKRHSIRCDTYEPHDHHIETPPGLTPPRLLAGGREGKVFYVESQYLELRRTKMRWGGTVGWQAALELVRLISNL